MNRIDMMTNMMNSMIQMNKRDFSKVVVRFHMREEKQKARHDDGQDDEKDGRDMNVPLKNLTDGPDVDADDEPPLSCW